MRKTLFEGRFIRLVDDNSWEFADRVGSAGVVCVVALNGGHVILVEEFRSAIQAPVISLPAGLIDLAKTGKPQETAIEAALRELREETGYTARRIEEVASGPISPGMTTERMTFFLAQDLLAGEQVLDDGEEIRLHRVPLQQLHDFLDDCSARGAEIDPKIFTGLYFVAMRGLMPGPLPWWRGWRARVARMRAKRQAHASAAHPSHAEADHHEAQPPARRMNADDALTRLGKVLNWLGLTIGFVAGAWVALCVASLLGAFGAYSDTVGLIVFTIIGVVVGLAGWLAGRAALYILAGK
jgi:ADP-ribose pyrophosphatase